MAIKCTSAALLPSMGTDSCPDVDFDVLAPVWLHTENHSIYLQTARNPASTVTRIEVFPKGGPFRNPIARMEVEKNAD